jgi:hypothetical protein
MPAQHDTGLSARRRSLSHKRSHAAHGFREPLMSQCLVSSPWRVRAARCVRTRAVSAGATAEPALPGRWRRPLEGERAKPEGASPKALRGYFHFCRWFWVLACVGFLGGCGPDLRTPSAPAAAQIAASSAEAETVRFLRGHWARPLVPQGLLPAAMAAQGISLAPRSCATCHASQFQDWRQSLHSRSMGPASWGNS